MPNIFLDAVSLRWTVCNGVLLCILLILARFFSGAGPKRDALRANWRKRAIFGESWLLWITLWSCATLNSALFVLAFRSNGFNKSLWNALWILTPFGIAIYGVSFFGLKKGFHFLFDSKHGQSAQLKDEKGDFGPHYGRYSDLARLLITISAAVIAFLVNTLANEKEPAPEIMQAIKTTAPIVVGFFGSSIALLILFLAVMAKSYEDYCHSETHSTYHRWIYAATISTGATGLVMFATGVVWLANGLF
jgi:hypothetical protein